MKIFLFLSKCFIALNSDVDKFSDGFRLPEVLCQVVWLSLKTNPHCIPMFLVLHLEKIIQKVVEILNIQSNLVFTEKLKPFTQYALLERKTKYRLIRIMALINDFF